MPNTATDGYTVSITHLLYRATTSHSLYQPICFISCGSRIFLGRRVGVGFDTREMACQLVFHMNWRLIFFSSCVEEKISPKIDFSRKLIRWFSRKRDMGSTDGLRVSKNSCFFKKSTRHFQRNVCYGLYIREEFIETVPNILD